jgi:hypothetical protein
LERLRRVQEEVTRNLKQREETINSSKDLLRKSEEDRSESLKTINDLQSKLQQAWDERDKAMAALGTNINPNSYYFLETTFQERETRCLESSKPYVPGDRFNGAARSDVCGNFTGQLWRFVPSTSVGYYRLQTLGSERDNRCLESWTSRMKDALGGASRMDPCGNYSGQFWKLESTRLGSYRLKSMFVEKENLCLDGGGPGPASMQPCNDGSGQRWKLVLKAE